jgi:AcrR family transcriptional regulator
MNKKELVLETAIKLFAINGFHATATAKIAKEAGVANGTLFQYFKTKEDLIVTIFISIKEEMPSIENAMEFKDTKNIIKHYVVSSLKWSIQNKEKFNFLQQFYASPFINLILKSDQEKYTKKHFEVLESGIDNGSLKPIPVDLMYLLISNQVFGMYQFLISNKNSKSKQKEIITTAFELLWDMITIK